MTRKTVATYKLEFLTRLAKPLFSQIAHKSTVTEKVSSEEHFLNLLAK